jgi:flagellar motor switch/type III secretory pathway protein FliN
VAGPANWLGDFSGLPAFTRSLLKIPVPVSVTLASKKQSTREVLELAVGSIIKFDKSCNQLLGLTVGEASIADGEVVKVGDKFGLRIHKMLMPRERFAAVRGGQ